MHNIRIRLTDDEWEVCVRIASVHNLTEANLVRKILLHVIAAEIEADKQRRKEWNNR